MVLDTAGGRGILLVGVWVVRHSRDLARGSRRGVPKKSENEGRFSIDSPEVGVIITGLCGRVGPCALWQVNSSSPNKAGVCPLDGSARKCWSVRVEVRRSRLEAVGMAKWCVERHKTHSRESCLVTSFPIEEFDPGSE